MRVRTLVAIALGAGLLCVLTAVFAGGATTQASFVDEEAGTGSVTAATSFDGTPPGPRAYDDVNGNGQWDTGEPTYTESDLYALNNDSVSLVIPGDVGTVNNTAGIDITSGRITADTDFQSGSGSVRLTATDGDINVRNQDVLAAGTASVTASGTARVDGASLLGVFDDVSVSAKTVSARDASIGSYFGSITLSARERGGGPLDATNASLTSAYRDITLESSGNMRLVNATLDAQYGEITADLRRGGRTLFVEGASIIDSDDTLVYSPRGTTVDGTPASGSVTAGSNSGGGPNAADTAPPSPDPPVEIERPIDWEPVAEQLNVPVSS